MWQDYNDKCGKSPITEFELGDNFIRVIFGKAHSGYYRTKVYEWRAWAVGQSTIDEMKKWALNHCGLCAFINRSVKGQHSRLFTNRRTKSGKKKKQLKKFGTVHDLKKSAVSRGGMKAKAEALKKAVLSKAPSFKKGASKLPKKPKSPSFSAGSSKQARLGAAKSRASMEAMAEGRNPRPASDFYRVPLTEIKVPGVIRRGSKSSTWQTTSANLSRAAKMMFSGGGSSSSKWSPALTEINTKIFRPGNKSINRFGVRSIGKKIMSMLRMGVKPRGFR